MQIGFIEPRFGALFHGKTSVPRGKYWEGSKALSSGHRKEESESFVQNQLLNCMDIEGLET